MRRHNRALAWGLVLVIVAVPVIARVDLVLVDGRVLQGSDVRRDRGDFVLTLDDGQEIAFPGELVESVRLSETGDRDAGSGLTERSEPETLAGSPPPPGPTGIRVAEPETLAGQPVEPPATSEQLEVLGEPSRFQEDIVVNEWVPETDWEMDPEKQNNFNPSTWSKGPVDPSWQPESSWAPGEGALASSRSSWQSGVVDPSWTPTDGFKKRNQNRRR